MDDRKSINNTIKKETDVKHKVDLNMCNIEFPHFGASYPDAHCIDGYLYDMDSYEDGAYTIGGDDPCPFCNTEEWLKDVLDDGIFKTREEALQWVEKMRKKYEIH